MKNVRNELTCLFGHHDYSETRTSDGYGHVLYFCNVCGRSARNELNCIYEYNSNGNIVTTRDPNGDIYYWETGDVTCIERITETYYFDKNGFITKRIPKNEVTDE